MKFKVVRPPVKLELEHGRPEDDDILVKADGVVLGWFSGDGYFEINYNSPSELDRLEEMGFEIDKEHNSIAVRR